MKNFAWWFEKAYTYTNTWMAGRNLRRQVYHRKTHFIAGLIWRVSVIKTMNMHSRFGIPRLLSRYLLKNRCFGVDRCIRGISEFVLKKLQVGSSTFLQRTGLDMAGLIKDNRWVLWAWKQGLWIMPRRFQVWAAYRFRHAAGGWKRHSGWYYPGS